MPPKAIDLDAIPADALLPLQDWLKLLAGRGVDACCQDVRFVYRRADASYNSHNTKERLATLDAKKLTTHLPDKEQRRTVVNAVKGIASGQVGRCSRIGLTVTHAARARQRSGPRTPT
jgi:hypothetical protein